MSCDIQEFEKSDAVIAGVVDVIVAVVALALLAVTS